MGSPSWNEVSEWLLKINAVKMQKVQPGLGIKACRDCRLPDISDLLMTLVYLLISLEEAETVPYDLWELCVEKVWSLDAGGGRNDI